MKYLFAPVPFEVLADRRLKLRRLRVLLVLFKYVNRKSQDGNIAWPSRKLISAWTGYPVKVISRVTSDLQRLGWLRKVGHGGCSRSARYMLVTSLPGSVAEAIVKQMTKRSRNNDEGVEYTEVACDGATTAETSTGQIGDGGDPEPGTQRSSNRVSASPQNEEGQGTDGIDQRKKRKEEVCARDRLARTLVDFFISSFSGLGLGVATDCIASQRAAWCEDLLALIDDGVSPNDIFKVIDWLLNENRERDHDGAKHPFVVHSPTDLRKKWSKLYEAAANDRGWLRTLEGTPECVRVRNMRRYVEYLFGVSVDEAEVGDMGEDDIHRMRLMDPRNKVPPHIAFCFCIERMFPEAVALSPAYTAAVGGNPEAQSVLRQVFPNLRQERLDELHRIAADAHGDQAADDREGQEARGINWNGGGVDPEAHGDCEKQDDDDDGDGDFEDDLDDEAREEGGDDET